MRFELVAIFTALGVAVGGGANLLWDNSATTGAAIGMLIGLTTGLLIERQVMKRKAPGAGKDG